jgi:GAF domain-containing protein
MAITNPKLLRLWLPHQYWAYAERQRVSSVLAVPLVHDRRVLGTFLLWRERGQPAFGAADEAYVSVLAGRLAVALAHPPR